MKKQIKKERRVCDTIMDNDVQTVCWWPLRMSLSLTREQLKLSYFLLYFNMEYIVGLRSHSKSKGSQPQDECSTLDGRAEGPEKIQDLKSLLSPWTHSIFTLLPYCLNQLELAFLLFVIQRTQTNILRSVHYQL